MKKRILSIVLAICLLFSCVPITVFAAGDVGGLDDLLSVLNKGGTQKLNKDYVIDQRTISVGKSITIDLNGHVIRFNGGRFNVGYKGKENITLTIKDNNPKATHSGQFEGLPDGGVITSSYGGTYGGAVQVCYEKCTFNLEGGTIYNCKADTGGCVYIDAGTFNMKGGTIDSCTATDDCGAVCLSSNNSIFNMTGGTIKNCKSTSTKNSLGFGGGVYVQRGTFTMTDGTIENCETLNIGGGVAVSSRGTFNMKGGTINNCSADYGGGVNTHGTFNMTGGTIDNCSAKSNGGGVCHESTDAGAASFTMTDGTIKNCSAENGGGVATFQNTKDLTFTMTGGTIDNCSAKIFGGGMFIENNGDCTLEGGTINNCSADYGGGVFVKHGDFIMKSGTIENCFARTSVGSYGYGGGVNIYYGNFTMTGGTVKDCTSTYSENNALCLFSNATMIADGGSIKGTSIIYSLDSTISKIKNTSSAKYTKFYGFVENQGTISGGVFYGGIQNKYSGTVTNPYKIVTFDLNGATGSVPNQWLVNAKGATANRPTDPTRENYKFMGWYKDDNEYDFATAVPDNIKIFTLKAKWVNSRVSTEAELKEAINAGITSIKLVSDITLLSTLDLSDKDITLDLNGHILTGNIKLSDTIKEKNPSKLTLIDSNPTATHTNSNLPLGGVLDGEITLDKTSFGSLSRLCANGGTVTGQVVLNDSNTQIVCTSTTPTAFMDYVKGSGAIHGGMFYGGVKQGCIEEEIVTFLRDGQRYAVGVVEFGQKAVAPVDPVKDGYVFAGWYIGNTKYSFQQPVIQDIVLNAKWVNEVTDEATLRVAINEGITTIKLMNDIKLSSALDLSQKDITIDLNGHVISGADISINTGKGKASLTLIDSNPTATHTDNTLPKGGVVTSKISMKQDGGGYNDCVLYANGGTVTSEFSTNTNAVAIKCTSNTPTAFTEKISGYAHLYGGIYYGTVNSSVTFEESKITFKNGDSNYAYEVLSSDKKSFEPISPSVMTGYQAFDGWYNGNTKYTFGSSLSQDITLTAKYKNPLTYNITYNLGSGTATNPTSYTVESDAITLNNPVKTGYTFTGWSGTGLTGEKNMTVTIPKRSTGHRAYTAHFSQNSYTVVFDTVGGSSISDKTGVKWTDQVLDGITDPTKDGWEFTGWKCGNMTVNANTKYSDLAENDTVTSVTLVAQWKDISAPTGEISIGTDSWSEFFNNINFGLFFKDTQTVTINASDNSGEAVKIEYLLSDIGLNKTDLADKEFTEYNGDFNINPDNKYVVYARLTDHAGNVTYISSEGVVLDASAPVISGVENGKTYCEAQTVTVDEKYIDSVTVNGSTVTLNANNQFTLNSAKGTQTIVVTDKAGNTAQVSVTVNNGHTAGNDDDDCSTPVYCIYHPDTVVVAAKSHDFSGEWHNDGTGHWHVCQNDGCTVSEAETPHSGTDDGDCTTAVICECGYVITVANAEHSYGEWKSNGDGTHTRYCTVDGCKGSEDGDCEGGQASYFKKAVCDECNEAYGELLTDSTAPTGEISIGTSKWNSFLNTITFGLFFKDTQSVTVTATDDSYDHDDYTDDKAVKVEYYLYSGDTALTQADLAGKEFTEYNGDFNINPDNKYVVYARLTDHAGNVTYISSEGVVLDASAPVISGIENSKTYCEAQTVTVDEKYIDSVTVNGSTVTLDANNQFTLNPAEDEQTIVVTDKAGNVSAEITVTVNEEHTDNDKDHKCDFCNENVGDHEDSDNDHKCDYGCSETIGAHEDADKDHLCDICRATLTECKDENPVDHKCDICGGPISDSECKDENPKDHECDICGATLSVCKDEDPIDHKCDICGATLTECKDENPIDHKCDICGATLTECKDENPIDHKCDICGATLSKCKDENPVDHKCDICGATLTECKDENPIDHKCDICGATLSKCKDENPVDHKCDICGAKLSECKDEDPIDHKCDICGATLSECKDENPVDHKCDICRVTLTECKDENPVDHKCDICGATLSVCKDEDPIDHKCDICGEPISDSECKDENPKDHECDICGATLSKCKDENPVDHKCDICRVTLTECKDENPVDHKCDICGEPISDSECKDKNPVDHECDICGATLSVCKDDDPIDHKCDICGAKLSDCKDENPKDHECDICGEPISDSECKDENPIDHKCDICGATLTEHSGGEAICTKKAICEVCGEPYGVLNSSNHNLEDIPANDATVTETGNKEYWHCLNCGKYFSDKDGKNGIELKDTVIAKLSPEIIDGKGQTVTEGEKKELTFRSNAAFSDYIRVELDGKTLDAKNYTVKEGSTVVTLKPDYVATLSVGKHTIGIVSENGTASTTLTVNEKTVDNNEKTVNINVNTVDNDTKSPQTGDNRLIALWIALLFVSGGVVIGTTAVRKKKSQ